MAVTASPLKKPFKMSPSPINLLHLHLQEFREATIQAEQSSNNKPHLPLAARAVTAMLTSPSVQRLSSESFGEPSRLYSADVYSPRTSCSTGMCPERVFVTPIPLSGPTPQDVAAAISQFQLNLSLNCGGSDQKYCFLSGEGSAEDDDQNYAVPSRGRIPNLNSTPPSEALTKFVGEVKSQNISRFTDYVLSYLVGRSEEEMEDYWNILSGMTKAQHENLDSIRIWNSLTLGCEIQKAMAKRGLIESPVRVEDLGIPPPHELLPLPQQGWKAPSNRDRADHKDHDCNNDNDTLSDARNYGDHDRDRKGKRKVQHPYDHLQIKKLQHDGVLRID